MKKKLITVALTALCLGSSFGMASAAVTSCTASIKGIGVNGPTDGDIYVILLNDSGAACNAWANGTTQQYVLWTTNTDQTYATLLTATSLGKRVWVKVADETTRNSYLTQMSMTN